MDAERLNLHAAVDYAALRDRPSYAITIPIVMHGFLRTHGHWGQALVLHRTALSAARRVGDRLGEAVALSDLGDIKHLTADYPAAVASLNPALELFRALGNRLGEANAIELHWPHPVPDRGLSGGRRQPDPGARAVPQPRRPAGRGRRPQRPGRSAVPDRTVCGRHHMQNQALELYRDLSDRNGQASALTDLGEVQQRNRGLRGSDHEPGAGAAAVPRPGPPGGERHTP